MVDVKAASLCITQCVTGLLSNGPWHCRGPRVSSATDGQVQRDLVFRKFARGFTSDLTIFLNRAIFFDEEQALGYFYEEWPFGHV